MCSTAKTMEQRILPSFFGNSWNLSVKWRKLKLRVMPKASKSGIWSISDNLVNPYTLGYYISQQQFEGAKWAILFPVECFSALHQDAKANATSQSPASMGKSTHSVRTKLPWLLCHHQTFINAAQDFKSPEHTKDRHPKPQSERTKTHANLDQ